MGGAEVISDRVSRDTRDIGVWLFKDNIALNVETLDLGESSGFGSVISDELGNNAELLGGVNGLSTSVESGVTHTVWVEITSIGITDTSVCGTVITSARGLTLSCADVRSKSLGHRVGFPDIELGAARSDVTGSRVGRVAIGLPADVVGLLK